MLYPPHDGWRAATAPETLPTVACVGALSDAIARSIALASTRRDTWIHRDAVAHIHQRRGLKRATVILPALTDVIQHPDYAGCRMQGRRGVMVCIRRFEAHDAVLVVIKLVPALHAITGHDELWVSTAYLVEHARRLRALLRQGIVHPMARG